MALLTNRPNWTNLIKFTKNGIEIANYVEVRAAIVDRLKEIFGQDIDIATNTADGQKIEMDSLIINNMLQAINSLYANLDADTAQGIYLDRLCKLSNVYRKPAQRSTVSLNITYVAESGSITIGPGGTFSRLTFADINGTTWTWQPSVLTSLTAGQAQSVIAVCDVDGKITAPAQSITHLIDTSITVNVVQLYDAEVGSNEETDAELRARRNGSLSVNATTVLQSLRARLLNIAAIQDVLLYNNDSESNAPAKDGTTILPHSVYAVLRYGTNANVADSLIGSILYEYMTPGIRYIETADNDSHSYEYMSEPLHQIVYWKKAVPVNPEVTVTIKKLTHYTNSRVYSSTFNVETNAIIANAVKDYLNSLPLGVDADTNFIKTQVQLADPLFKTQATFLVTACTIDGGSDNYSNEDTYFDYQGTYTIDSETDDEIVLTIQ